MIIRVIKASQHSWYKDWLNTNLHATIEKDYNGVDAYRVEVFATPLKNHVRYIPIEDAVELKREEIAELVDSDLRDSIVTNLPESLKMNSIMNSMIENGYVSREKLIPELNETIDRVLSFYTLLTPELKEQVILVSFIEMQTVNKYLSELSVKLTRYIRGKSLDSDGPVRDYMEGNVEDDVQIIVPKRPTPH